MVGKIVELLRQHPEGLTSGEIREKLCLAAHEQSQLDRRRRDVRKWYHVIVVPNGSNPRYRLGEKRTESVSRTGINGRLRATVLHAARGRCQMCGRSVAADGVKLQVDHKIPQAWGGTNDLENLWALCEECNHGKKDLFASQVDNVKIVMKHSSVHVRIGELLKLNFGTWVPSQLIEFVANRDDWKKRTRELRYLGWKIGAKRQKQPNGRVTSSYMLEKFGEWPSDPSGWIQQFERDRAKRNRTRDSSDDQSHGSSHHAAT
ncbi:MAG TPA: HNH endonuclease [Verrucomicrobiales bacterium]|nr:HNH endonuclease [Verrucomicrobiales bacterium]